MTPAEGRVTAQPEPDEDTMGYWTATGAGRIELARCGSCRIWQHPPLERCRRCGDRLHFEPVSGRGRLHSWIRVHGPAAPGFDAETPYLILLVELAEQSGLRLSGRPYGDAFVPVMDMKVAAVVVDAPGGHFRTVCFGALEGEPN